MVVDYSKWDKIELSDDSDIEVHPNVDKRSFINAKRRQIHETRALRKQQIAHYGTEITMNAYLASRLDSLIAAVSSTATDKRPEEVVMSALFELTSADSAKDAPPVPEGSPSYAQMLAALVDTVKKEVDAEAPAETWPVFVQKLKDHRKKLAEHTQETQRKKAALEKEDAEKITADDLHEGFSAGHINKDAPAPAAPEKKKTTTKVQAVEQLNAPSLARPGVTTPGDQSVSSGAEADVEEEAADDDDDAHIEPTALGRAFAQLGAGDYRASMEFISRNPSVVAEKETDGLLVEAFNAALKGDETYAQTCVHQALLLQYCRQLGRDGVALFFKRITTPGHQASRIFADDVAQTFHRIRSRAAEIKKDRAEDKGVEQIQLHAVDPGTSISISVPPRVAELPEGLPAEQREGLERARGIFETFPPGLQRALESGSLDKVNEVLGKMSVEEAEEIVGQLSEGGMLSLEEGVIDATTEEGREQVRRLEEESRVTEVQDEDEEAEEEEGDESGETEREKGKGKGKAPA